MSVTDEPIETFSKPQMPRPSHLTVTVDYSPISNSLHVLLLLSLSTSPLYLFLSFYSPNWCCNCIPILFNLALLTTNLFFCLLLLTTSLAKTVAFFTSPFFANFFTSAFAFDEAVSIWRISRSRDLCSDRNWDWTCFTRSAKLEMREARLKGIGMSLKVRPEDNRVSGLWALVWY